MHTNNNKWHTHYDTDTTNKQQNPGEFVKKSEKVNGHLAVVHYGPEN